MTIKKIILMGCLPVLLLIGCSSEQSDIQAVTEIQSQPNPVFNEQMEALEKAKQLEKTLQLKMDNTLKTLDDVSGS